VVESVKKAMEESRKTECRSRRCSAAGTPSGCARSSGWSSSPRPSTRRRPREDDPLTYNDPSGRPVLPTLVVPPIDGPDVEFRAKAMAAEARTPRASRPRKGGRWQLGNQGRVHQLMSAYSMIKIEKIYATVFENILGERVSTKP
jgi:hypothetical protein